MFVYFSLLVLKGIYEYWSRLLMFSRGVSKWKFFPGILLSRKLPDTQGKQLVEQNDGWKRWRINP